MSLVYDFHFNDTRLAGKSATVVDTATGTEVEGSPLTLDASGNGSLTLAEKSTYLATTSNANLGIANARQNGQPNLPASIAAGGGGGSTTDRGTLYLKATGTGIDISAEQWGDGTDLPYELDPDKTSTGDWWEQVEGGFSIKDQGFYLCTVAGAGTVHFPSTPDVIGVDVMDSNKAVLGGDDAINIGWWSDGSDNSPAFTPAEDTALVFLTKTSSTNFIPDNTQRNDLPFLLVGLAGDNETTPDTTGSTLDIDFRLAITRFAPGEYSEADFS